MSENTPTIEKYEVGGYSFEETAKELEISGYNLTIKNLETHKILVDKTIYSITSLIIFYEIERTRIIVEWIANKLEGDSHE